MTTRLWVTAATLIFAALAAASGVNAGDSRSTADERALLKLEGDWIAAEGRRDAAALRLILHDKFICTFGGGKSLDKEAFIKAVTEDEPDSTLEQEISDRSVTVVGDTAVIVETDTMRQTKDGQSSTMANRFTVTYIKRGGRWQALAEQSARINR